MRIIDMDTWPRRDHFNLFRTFNHPHFSMCANVDISKTLPYIKEHKHSFTIAIAYLIGRTANSIQEFRLRIRGDQVIEHEVVSPSFTILIPDDLFSFCNVDYVENFVLFEADALAIIEAVKTVYKNLYSIHSGGRPFFISEYYIFNIRCFPHGHH